MRHTLALAGWLLYAYHGDTIATYRTEKDCQIAAEYAIGTSTYCIPDATEVESWQGKRP
jgi:hypothetical protein